MEHGLK